MNEKEKQKNINKLQEFFNLDNEINKRCDTVSCNNGAFTMLNSEKCDYIIELCYNCLREYVYGVK